MQKTLNFCLSFQALCYFLCSYFRVCFLVLCWGGVCLFMNKKVSLCILLFRSRFLSYLQCKPFLKYSIFISTCSGIKLLQAIIFSKLTVLSYTLFNDADSSALAFLFFYLCSLIFTLSP